MRRSLDLHWVAFNGSRAAEIIASLRLSQADPIYTCTKEQGAKLAAYVQDMLAHNSFTLSGRYYRLGLLMQFLSVLAEAQRDLLPPADNNAYISHMTNFIRTHLEEPFTVQELADYDEPQPQLCDDALQALPALLAPRVHPELPPHQSRASAPNDDLLRRVDCLLMRLRQKRLLPARFLRKAGMPPTAYRRQQQSSYLQATEPPSPAEAIGKKACKNLTTRSSR